MVIDIEKVGFGIDTDDTHTHTGRVWELSSVTNGRCLKTRSKYLGEEYVPMVLQRLHKVFLQSQESYEGSTNKRDKTYFDQANKADAKHLK